MDQIKTVLASSSPRRKEILELIWVRPDVIIPLVKEEKKERESNKNFIKRITEEKMAGIFPEKYFGSLIISADTVVVIGGEIIGKPNGRSDAKEILEKLSGKTHIVMTGLKILYKERSIYSLSKTKVKFKDLSKDEIRFYLDKENYSDKAGAYAIQGYASVFVKKIEGCFFNVMGFPVNSFYSLLGKLCINFEQISNLK